MVATDNSERTSTQAPRKHSVLRGAFVVFLLAALVGFVSLGTWQLQRLGWKRALIERIETRVNADPVPPPSFLAWSESRDARAEFEYQRVYLEGHFLHDKEVQIHANTLEGPGYWVMTPLETSTEIIWVNRGYVPSEKRQPANRAEAQTPGPVRVVGLLRMPETLGLFVRENVPEENRWYHRNVADLTAAQQIDRTAPYFVDADASPNPGGWPKGGLTVLNFRDNHLSYALTWYGLALMVIVALVFFFKTEWRPLRRDIDEE